ncbi:hypothetical protein [Bacillus pseudomycoides]|uniref:hypothetical protein n=2 Tax=Bacillus pseudomycoides TaxID=64104 RepID=UPI000BEFBDE1|nr:hypothetical protein [Bacillus pseudomycoides]PEM69315.1 hypothetical protein CN619_21505 [Bacillus pseudomycoides]PGA62220.1 hypothetical protein COL84_13700 [Bacillus pseudomycoides]
MNTNMDFKRSLKKTNLEEITKEMVKLDKDINKVLTKIGRDSENVQYDSENLTEKFLYFQYCSVAVQLKNIHTELNYLLSSVLVNESVQKKSNRQKKTNLEEITKGLIKLNKGIKRVLIKTGYDCDNIKYDNHKSTESPLFVEYRSVANQLENIHMHLDYLLNPVIEEGCISKDRNGRYILPSGKGLMNGSKCEVLSEINGTEEWIYTLIEKGKEDYYATALGEGTSIAGLKVRLRI